MSYTMDMVYFLNVALITLTTLAFVLINQIFKEFKEYEELGTLKEDQIEDKIKETMEDWGGAVIADLTPEPIKQEEMTIGVIKHKTAQDIAMANMPPKRKETEDAMNELLDNMEWGE